MSYRISAIIVEDFYDNPDEVRKYALDCEWRQPKGAFVNEYWYSTVESPAYITNENISKLEKILKIQIDLEHFNSDWEEGGCRWNAVFHVKLAGNDFYQKGIHNHVTDDLNSPRLGDNLGYSAIVNLTPDELSFENNGQDIWKSKLGLEWYNTVEIVNDLWPMVGICSDGPNKPGPIKINHDKYGEWELLLRMQYRYNTAIIMPASAWHAGSDGWGDTIEKGRMVQTFFFRGKNETTRHKELL